MIDMAPAGQREKDSGVKQLVPVGIVGAGFAVPDNRVANADLAHLVDTSDEWIRTRTGIRERRLLANGDNTSDLASEAARRALDNAGVEPGEVDAVVVATVSADMPFPNAACLVQRNLGLPRAAAFDVGAACSGYIYGLVTGAMMVQTGRARTVLVIGADALSKMVDWQDRSTCVLFGDGAGATVLRPVEEGYGLIGASLGSDGSGGDLLKVSAEGREDGRATIRMAGREVFKFAVRIQLEACEAALAEAGLTADDIDWLVPHQANIRIIESAAERLGLPPEKVYINVDRYGNTSAASIPIALAEAMAEGRFKHGDHVMTVGFGGGLNWGAALLRWSQA